MKARHVILIVALASSASSIAAAASTLPRINPVTMLSTSILLLASSILVLSLYVLRVERAARRLGEALSLKARRRKSDRRRYLVFQVYSKAPLVFDDVRAIVLEAVSSLAGSLGLSTSEVKLLEYDPESQRGIIRFKSSERDLVMAALTFTRKYRDSPVAVYPVKTTGTLRKAREILNIMKRD